ncbi:MAG: hypothetical protein MI919_26555, partial [Holophagales bacterium]|nr:hypothetical protein [Holophagales bacterium]
DEDSDAVISAVNTLSRRHLVLVASSRELALRQLGEQPVRSFDAALEVAATRHYLQHRRKAHDAARSAGAFVIDVEPQDLPAALVHRYLEIKRAGQL